MAGRDAFSQGSSGLTLIVLCLNSKYGVVGVPISLNDVVQRALIANFFRGGVL
jgi:hypothetical protein